MAENELRTTAVHPWQCALPPSRRAVRGTPDHGFYQSTRSEAHLEVTGPLQQGDRVPGQRHESAILRFQERAGSLVPRRVWVPRLLGESKWLFIEGYLTLKSMEEMQFARFIYPFYSFIILLRGGEWSYKTRPASSTLCEHLLARLGRAVGFFLLMLRNRLVHMAFLNIQDHKLTSAATRLRLPWRVMQEKPASLALMTTMIRHMSPSLCDGPPGTCSALSGLSRNYYGAWFWMKKPSNQDDPWTFSERHTSTAASPPRGTGSRTQASKLTAPPKGVLW